MSIDVTRQHRTLFWQLFGINQITARGHAIAQAGTGMVDVMVAVDETASMSSADMVQLRAATQAFVDQLQPSLSNPRTNQVGIAQFQGQVCPTGDGVWAWGANGSGQLGDGTTTNRSTPVLAEPSGAIHIEAGGAHSLALQNSGTNPLRAWGDNSNGQLGLGTTTSFSTPQTVTLSNVSEISAGNGHSEIYLSSGTNRVRTFGLNASGQIGNGGITNQTSPVSVTQSNVSQVSAGGSHSLALTNTGFAAWGANGSGQLGDGTTIQRTSPVSVTLANLTAVAAGGNHSLGLLSSGTNRVRSWGLNTSGQLGITSLTSYSTPQTVTLGNVSTVAAGGSHSLALKTDGTVWAWGSNAYGQLGDGTTIDRTSPVQVAGLSSVVSIAAGGDHSLALKNDGTVWSWGRNDSGQLGDGTTTNRSNVVQVSGLSGAQLISAGTAHSLAALPAVCQPDAHVLTNLTADKAKLNQIISGPAAACPALPAQPPLFNPAQSNTTYGCPLDSVGGSGTYERSGLAVMFMTSPSWDMWSTAKGGRTSAHKVLVLETDGANSVAGLSVAQADTNSVNYATTVKPGADQTAKSPSPVPDDIEIFTIGFYGGGESGLVSGSTPLCPSSTLPAGRTSIDDLMISISSSTPGTCDHYYPQAKSASLPTVFTGVASAIGRGQLVQ
jgi:alpha-tubulin suppressor-like RCC1 family protein